MKTSYQFYEAKKKISFQLDWNVNMNVSTCMDALPCWYVQDRLMLLSGTLYAAPMFHGDEAPLR